jgi:cation diffusion facilitator family transporter
VRGARIEHTDWAIAVTAASTVASWAIARRLRRTGGETDSVILRADALHYAVDVWTNGGILAGLVLLRLTGSTVFDSLIAMAVAVMILVSAYRLLVASVHDLMDAALPEAEQREIERIVRSHRAVVASHRLRTRRSGSQRQIDFSIVVCRQLPLGEAHALVDHIEAEIESAIGRVHAVVHVEPCGPECPEGDRCGPRARRDLLAHEPRG